LNLLKAKITQAEMSIKGLVNRQLIAGTVGSSDFVPGNSAKDLFPLGWFLGRLPATNPSAGGNVGDIARATYAWWRHRAARGHTGAETGHDYYLEVSTYKSLIASLKRMLNYTSRGADGSSANLILTTQVMYETYESAVDERSRLTDTKLSEIGFDNVKVADQQDLGGGFTMVKGSAVGRSGRNRPRVSQCAYQRASMSAGLNVVESVSLVVMATRPMPARFMRCNDPQAQRLRYKTPLSLAKNRPIGSQQWTARRNFC
jgi:hypothetical protein